MSCVVIFYTLLSGSNSAADRERLRPMAKIVANDRQTKTIVARRRAYKMRQSGHDTNWIAKKLGMSEAGVRAMLV